MTHSLIDMDAAVGGTQATTYVTLVEANHYHDAHRNFNTEWNDALDDKKNSSILWAMSIIETRIKWRGIKASYTQSLSWPRLEAFDDNGHLIGYDYVHKIYVIPEVLKHAVAELAYNLLKEDRTADPSSKGLGSLTVDVIKLDFNTSDAAKTIPESVLGLLTGLGVLKGKGMGSVSLVRV